MEKKLVFVSVYTSFNKTFEELCEKYQYPYEIIDAKLEDAVTMLKKRFPAEFPAVIISRGVTAELIQKAYANTVVISADPDDSDLIDALEEAKKYGNRIGCLMSKRILPYNTLDRLQKIMQFDTIKLFVYETGEEMEAAFASARAHGLNAMVGGGQLGSSIGIKYGLPTVFIASGVRTIWKAITKSWDILTYLEREHEQEMKLNAVINVMEDGIVGICAGIITTMNSAAEKIFNLYSEQAVGRDVKSICAELARFVDEPSNGSKTIAVNSKHVLAERIIEWHNGDDRENIVMLHDVGHLQTMEQKVRKELYIKGLVAKHKLEDIVGTNERMRRTIEEAYLYAKTDASILISGESGTGKELLAQGIHNASRRRNAPFVAINCAELPEPLLESELFGYVEGTFTGAKRGGKKGLFELAHSGTLFLDEINSANLALQGKLLRAIQEKQVRRIGSDTIIPVDIRIISAVNVDMNREIQEGRFRRDLYYRLNTLYLYAIPLRERPEDIPVLAEYFCKMHSSTYDCRPAMLTEKMIALLQKAAWPGNIRELDSVVQRFCVLSKSVPDAEALLEYCMKDAVFMKDAEHDNFGDTITIRKGNLDQMENELIERYVEESGGNRGTAAQKLGISRTTMWRRTGNKEEN